MWMTKTFFLVVAMCVANSNAYTLNRSLFGVPSGDSTGLAKEAQELVDDIKATTKSTVKVMGDVTNIVNKTRNIITKNLEESRQCLVDNIVREIHAIIDTERTFFKNLFGNLSSLGENTSTSGKGNSSKTFSFQNLFGNGIGAAAGANKHVPANVLGSNVLITMSNNDENDVDFDGTEAEENENDKSAIVLGGNTIIGNSDNNPDPTANKVNNGSNESADSASSEGVSQREVEEYKKPATFPTHVSKLSINKG